MTLYTAGAFPSGDFDFVAANDADMDAAMLQAGFVHEDRPGRVHFGWHHPSHPKFGFQQVTGPLFDGRTDRGRAYQIRLRSGLHIVLPAVEDMIADRLAQHAVASPSGFSRLNQARAMVRVASAIEHPYLVKRVNEEGGDVSLLDEPCPGTAQ